jgi:hypothetical protein
VIVVDRDASRAGEVCEALMREGHQAKAIGADVTDAAPGDRLHERRRKRIRPAFLASNLSGWVTGTTIHVDGGALAAAGWVRMPNGRWTHRPIVTGSGYRDH